MRIAAALFCFTFLLLPKFSLGQQFFRVMADFSTKQKNADSTLQLTVGKVYFDRTKKKIVYMITFPQVETWVMQDSFVFKVQKGKMVSKEKSGNIVSFSIFNLAANGTLSDYGLKNGGYKVGKVEKEKGLTLTRWIPHAKLASKFGEVVLATEQKRLAGVVLYNPSKELVSRQFFRKYQNFSGLEFPLQVTQFTYTKKGQNLTVTTYKNVVVNALSEDAIYNFVVPGY